MEPKGNDMAGDELVERLRKLAEKATPGERELNGAGQLVIEDGPALFELPRRTKHYTADHWFIAACSTDNIRKLLARLSRSTSTDAVAVKALEWTNYVEPPFVRYARCSLGMYRVERGRVSGSGWWFYFNGNMGDEGHATEAGAETAAQADFEARIRSALACPSLQGGAEPGEEELCKLVVRIWGYDWVEFEDIPPPGADGRDPIGEAYGWRLNAQDAVRGILRRFAVTKRPITHSLGETGGADELVEPVAWQHRHKWPDGTFSVWALGKSKPTQLITEERALVPLSALTRLRAEREVWAKNALDNDDCRIMWQARAEAAESSLAAEKLKVAELERVLRKHHDWHDKIGTVIFPAEGEQLEPTVIDLSAEYGDSTLCEETMKVLK